MPGLPDAHLRALTLVHGLLESQEGLVWALTGSASLAVRGMDLVPHDLDLVTDREGAYRIGEILAEYCVRPVALGEGAPYIRSHFGQFSVEGVGMDVMGDPLRLGLDGVWAGPEPLPPLIRRVCFEGLSLPVLPLEAEARFCRLLRRDGRAEEIEAFLRLRCLPGTAEKQGGS